MCKVIQSNENITPYGGINFIYQAIQDFGLDTFIDETLGKRNVRAHYSYSDVVLSLFGNALCQGNRLSDIAHLKDSLLGQNFSKIPSADTLEYVCKALKTSTVIEITKKDVKHEMNYDNKMNKALVALAVKTKQLKKEGKNYTLDYDNVVVATEKQDTNWSYKKIKGYHPGIAFIGRIPVHLENRNGNTPASYQQKEILERCFDNLDEQGIKAENFRGDSASYQKQVVELVSKRATNFYIRIDDFEGIRTHCAQIEKWEQIEINSTAKEVAKTNYCPFKGTTSYTIVVTRVLKKDTQYDLMSGCAYDYYGIMTNNETQSCKEVIEFYNQRGDSENSNRYLLNDFNLHYLPFMDMDTNTVFMYLMALCNILFEWTKTVLVNNKTVGVKLNMRIKNICFHYIIVATKIITHARQKIIKVFSKQLYKILKI